MLFKFSFAVSENAPKIFFAICPNLEFSNLSFNSVNFCPTASKTFVINSLILPKPDLTAPHSLFTAFRNVSDLSYSNLNPTTNAAIAITTNAIGFIAITAFNADCATVMPPVVAVAAVVAAVCATVAAVPAVSAAVSAAVAAVLAVIFAIIWAAPAANFCPVVIVVDIPCATFPNPIDSGPTAAATSPILIIVSCCAGESDVNHFVKS